MSYQVLARKYRPRNFDTLVGQEHVVRALIHALDQQRLHHAYLFTGTRGVGKTTLSRILAKSLNCQGADGSGGITSQPCNVCEACIAIDAGRFVDYIEMDAASNRGVDEMAQLLEQAVYAPSNARFKVYMIDEVHMLTSHAFNSMLKTLEEPPEHVKFILATTDPQKIPVTVLSRCLQFNLKQMPPGHIISHLDKILGQENIAFEASALRLLAQGAHGSMRDALSLTDQAIAYAAGKVTLDAVQSMLGALDQSYLVRILDALAMQDGTALLAVADDMATRSLSYNTALQDLATLLHQLALAQTVPTALTEDMPRREDIVRLASQFTPEETQLFYQIAVHGRNELGLAPDEYAGFSMTLLRMLAFRPVAAGSAPATSVEHPDVAAPARSNPAIASLEAARAASGKKASRPAAATPQTTLSQKTTPAAMPDDAPPPWNDTSAGVTALDCSVPQQGHAPAPAVDAPIPALPAQTAQITAELDWDGDWQQLASDLPLRGMVAQMARQSELICCAKHGNTVCFHIRIPLDTLRAAGNIEKLSAVLSERFHIPIRVETEIGAVALTANARTEENRAARQREAELTLQNDPFVQIMMREFDAAIVPGSIRAL